VTNKGKPTRPRNQLGEFATRTPQETIARLKEKVSKNHGGANRERIQAQISEERAANEEKDTNGHIARLQSPRA
jgi:hypothetical protein